MKEETKKQIEEALIKETQRSATNTMDAILLHMLKDTLKRRSFDEKGTHMDALCRKYKIKR